MASSSSSSNNHLRPALDRHRSNSSSKISRSRPRHSSTSSRAGAAGGGRSPAPPPGTHHELNAVGNFEIDSADPVVGDFLYRLDDYRNQPRSELLDGGDGDGATASTGATDTNENGSRTTKGPKSKPAADDHLAWMQGRPWWRKPSEWWLIPMATTLAFASGATISSKVELYTQLVCEEMATTGRLALDVADTLLRLPNERPPMSAECRTNPDVVGGSAALQMRITITMGLLSALTTGWWGGLSDRRGRTKVLAAAVLGILVADGSYLAMGFLPVASLPLGTNFMLFSSAIEGCLGGLATLIAAHQAYISDCTPSGTRARSYAQMTGFFYCGLMLGPALGGLLVRSTGSLMSSFVLATIAHGVYFLLVLFVVPESNSPDKMKTAMLEYEKDTRMPNASETEEGRPQTVEVPKKVMASIYRRLLAPVAPVAMLLPRRVGEVERLQSRPATPMPSYFSLRQANAAAATNLPATSTDSNGPSTSHISVSHISRARQRDWNLFWLSLAYALEMTLMGLLTVKSLYAQEVFDWGAAELGFFYTAVSVARVLCLTIILPIVIKLWHKPPKGVALPQDAGNETEQTPLLDEDGRRKSGSKTGAGVTQGKYGATGSSTATTNTSAGSSRRSDDGTDDEDSHSDISHETTHEDATVEELWTLRAEHLRLLHDSHFDLKLARVSLLINCLAYLLLCFFRGQVVFIGATALTSLGGGGAASMSSLALALLQRPTEAGKLFGAWAILSALASTVVGPLVFTFVFRATARTMPHAIFYAGEAVLLASLGCLCAIRIRRPRSLPALPPRPDEIGKNDGRRTEAA